MMIQCLIVQGGDTRTRAKLGGTHEPTNIFLLLHSGVLFQNKEKNICQHKIIRD